MTPPILGAGDHPVLCLGGVAEIGPQVSWCPPGVEGRQPVSAYLIKREGSAVLVDTGVGIHAPLVLEQLHAALDPSDRLSVILTRTEMECCLNLPAIERELTVDRVWYTGGITVPVTNATATRIQVDPGTSLDLEASPGLVVRVYSPLLRLLPVLWIGDQTSRTLLTSDSFCHLVVDEHRASPPTAPDTAMLRAFHDVKFGWIAEASAAADTEAMAQNLRDIVDDCAWEAIGPTYGAALVGVDTVRAHAAELVHHLREARRHAA